LTEEVLRYRLIIERKRNTLAHIERHGEILKILSRLRSVSVQDLTARLDVSEVTIRKDLAALEDMGKLVRTRGGARLAEDASLVRTVRERDHEHVVEKRTIARCAKELVEEGDTIYIDSGSTLHMFAQEIKHMNLQVVTNSIDVLVELSDAEEITLFSLGGSYRKDAGSFIGPVTIEALKHFQIGTAFLGTTGFSARGVFSSQNIIEGQVKSQVIRSSERRVMLADSSKYKHKAFSIFARQGDIDILVTDGGFTDIDVFRSMGIEVLIADRINMNTQDQRKRSYDQ